MRGLPGSPQVSEDVIAVIAGRLGYGNMGVDGVAVGGWVSQGHCPLAVLEEAGSRMADVLDLEVDCELSGLTREGETVWLIEGEEVCYTVTALVEMWRSGPRQRGVDFPLTPVVRAFFEQPRRVTPEMRETGRVIPAKLAVVAPGDHRGYGGFGLAAHVGGSGRSALILPGFESPDTVSPVLPLLLHDLEPGEGGVANTPGAPLSLRLFVESVLSVPLGDRTGDGLVALEVPLRSLLKWLYPGDRLPRPSEYWPRLMKAVEVLDSKEARIPWYDSTLGKGGFRRVVSVGDIPRGA